MQSNEHLNDDSEFDRLLGHANWPEPNVERIARLRDHWWAIARQRRRRLTYGVVGIAASILVMAGILASRDQGIPSKVTSMGNNTVAELASTKSLPAYESLQPSHAQTSVSTATVVRSKPTDGSTEPRDANLYERAVLVGAVSKRQTNRHKPAESAPGMTLLQELIVASARDPHADVDERLALVQRDFARYERSLWDAVRSGSSPRRLGAARVIARIGTAQSLPILTDLLDDPATHEAAILGFCRLASASDLTRLATVESNVELRRNLLRALLARQTEESVGLYLRFVNEKSFRPDALTVVATMADPPLDLLLAFLESPQTSLRLAAAQALGRLPDTDIARRLSESVYRGIGRQEALVALLLSRNAQAASFLNQARQDLYLVASVQAAEQQILALTILERR